MYQPTPKEKCGHPRYDGQKQVARTPSNDGCDQAGVQARVVEVEIELVFLDQRRWKDYGTQHCRGDKSQRSLDKAGQSDAAGQGQHRVAHTECHRSHS